MKYCVGLCYQLFYEIHVVWSGVRSWTSNPRNAGSIPGELDENFVILLGNVKLIFDWH